ncbi:helix-turn-helix domain-containing protein [Tsukamurella sputi]|uniref:Helix-turn-helix domain-containing protein n=1 Tax=Tsukamurella sputi TaxID=2591848 RepID=A0A5C5RVC0_9ACTN|nr:helix-turn-helix domain-containing protein [Tsukamurella sputi]TWS26612.1 helix-turn-helix domain-containing protein [Tsukamurella sputi]
MSTTSQIEALAAEAAAERAVEDRQPEPRAENTPIWLTRAEVAERFSVPVQTLATWAVRGFGPRFSKFGRHCRYKLSDVIAWENAQSVGGDAA